MKALLIVDMLRDFIDEGGALEVGKHGRDIISFIKQKKAEYRENGDKIIYICDTHEADDKEFEMFPPHCVKFTKGSRIIEDIEVRMGEKMINKRRYSSFTGTDLDIYLRENNINEISIVGVCTNICVLYTCADARSKSYKVNVYKDGVASFDNQAHDFALKEIENTLGCSVI